MRQTAGLLPGRSLVFFIDRDVLLGSQFVSHYRKTFSRLSSLGPISHTLREISRKAAN